MLCELCLAIAQPVLQYEIMFFIETLKDIEETENVQNYTLRSIFYLPKYTPLNNVNVELAIPPLKLRMESLTKKLIKIRKSQLKHSQIIRDLKKLSIHVENHPFWSNKEHLIISKLYSQIAPTLTQIHKTENNPIYDNNLTYFNQPQTAYMDTIIPEKSLSHLDHDIIKNKFKEILETNFQNYKKFLLMNQKPTMKVL